MANQTNAPGDRAAADRWPAHLQTAALRWMRSSARYDETIAFYRDLIGLPVVDSFSSSYGEDGTIFGLPDTGTHMEVVRAHRTEPRPDGFEQIVFYLGDNRAVERATRRLREAGARPDGSPHPYWVANGAVVFTDPDGRSVVFAPWVYGRDPEPVDRVASPTT